MLVGTLFSLGTRVSALEACGWKGRAGGSDGCTPANEVLTSGMLPGTLSSLGARASVQLGLWLL